MNKTFLLRYRIKHVGITAIISLIAGICIGVLSSLFDNIYFLGPVLRGLLLGLLIGASIGFFEEFVFHNSYRKKSYLKLLFSRTILYSLLIMFWLIIINSISLSIFDNFSTFESVIYYISATSFDRDMILVVITAFSIISILQIKRLHTRGELLKFVLGVYHKPKETDRIFLFIDLKSSTSIAEKLGNIEYSNFLIDYFYDITDAVLMADAEIYQYVGDEIILTWPFQKGIDDARCINCFFDIKNSIELLKDKYINRYGIYPEFTAGLHGGKVVATWIGDIKKEIVYHGDVLNTTSRLESECKRYNQSLLVTEFILNSMELPKHLEATFIDELRLRGKENSVKIFGVDYLKANNQLIQ